MDEYISREAVIKKIVEVQDKATSGTEDVTYYRAIKIIREMPAADVQLVISGDNCIVCGRDVRKDNVYYDVNGGTICESCMNTKCKCKNGR